ncbi:MAG: tyrosine-type recombinase/integrase [Xanthobacteraceae bacterium]
MTDTFVHTVRPETSVQHVWDLKLRGLVLAIQPSGTKSWKCVYSRLGRPRWMHLGNAGSIGLSDARRLAGRIMFQVAEGKDPAAERAALRIAGSFEELADRYREHAMKRNRSWKQADKLVRRYLLPRWGKLRAADISRSDVKALFAQIEAPILANQVLAAASAIFAWAIREEVGGIIVNPCTLVERNDTRSRERVLADSDVPLFWQAFDDAGLIRGTALKLILLTGQRPGEVAHMRREHIVDGWWEMPGEPVPELNWPGTKNGASHRVWLTDQVRDLIAEIDPEATQGFVFTGKKRLDSDMRLICEKLGVEKATPHDLRRSFSTKVASLGFGRDALNRVTNHKEGGIATVYDRHGYADENKKIMTAVAAAIMALVDGTTDDKVIQGRFVR